MKPVAIYARVSTVRDEQEKSIDAQVETLKKYCEARDWPYKVFTEQKSGMKAERERPALGELMAAVRRGRFAGIVVTNTMRLGRHPLHMINLWYELQSLRVNFTAVEDGIDTTSPMGEAFFMIFSVIGKMQRDAIARSVKRGLDHARAQGKILGRPRPVVNVADVVAFKGSLREAQKKFGIGKDTVAAMKRAAGKNGSLTGSKTA